MNNEKEKIDKQHEDLLKAINDGELNIGQVDWISFLSTYINTFSSSNYPISTIAWTWALCGEIDEPTKRMDLLGIWQDVAHKCFSTKEESYEFIANCDCLVRINSRLRWLYIHESAQLPHTYDGVWGGKNLNELALLWSDNHVRSCDLVALASEIHNTVHAGEKAPIIEYFLYSSRNYNKLYFDNIYDFSRNLFLAESFRQYLVTGKMNTDAPLTFVDIKRKIRNACFDEYIRLRLAQIEAEMDDDNSLLLDPTIDDLYQELYNQESSVVNREQMFEDFRGSQAYHDRWYRGRPEVLQMIKYFIDYLNWKMEHLHDESKQAKVIVQNGDYVAGNKYTGTVIENVENGGIGVQQVFNQPQSAQTAQETTTTFTPEDKRGPKYQVLFADKNGDEDTRRTKIEKERLLRYLRDYDLASVQLTSSKRNELIKVVVCFCKKWIGERYASTSISSTALARFLIETCGIDKKVNQISVANVLQRLLASGEYDETIYDQVCEYF